MRVVNSSLSQLHSMKTTIYDKFHKTCLIQYLWEILKINETYRKGNLSNQSFLSRIKDKNDRHAYRLDVHINNLLEIND